ncbi:hypothetical protein [Microbulbifer zhoushanensis]|uniref:hypothetical protein n=1 Tax=Microbulbifer zhoushanensis TaxID=2904254 RepID=UPI001F3F1AB8|nr:hypothetical protein [Microbulbifer zhoushanensis]
MVESNSPSSSDTRSAAVAGASFGALLPLDGLPALAEALGLLDDALLDWLLADASLAELLAVAALLLEELEDDELLLDDDALCSSSEKSISSGGWPSLLLEGSGGMRRSSGCASDSLYTGLEGESRRAVGSGMLSPAELRRRASSLPESEAVLACWLDRSPDSMLGIEVLGWAELLLGIEEELLRLLGGLLWGMLLAVCGLDWLWERLDELLDDCDDELLDDGWDWDCDCEGCAGGCCWVCWLLQPAITALSTTIEARVCQPGGLLCCENTAFRSVIFSLLVRRSAPFGLERSVR